MPHYTKKHKKGKEITPTLRSIFRNPNTLFSKHIKLIKPKMLVSAKSQDVLHSQYFIKASVIFHRDYNKSENT